MQVRLLKILFTTVLTGLLLMQNVTVASGLGAVQRGKTKGAKTTDDSLVWGTPRPISRPVSRPTPTKKRTKIVRVPLLTFEWRILACGASGADTEVSPETIFHTGDIWKLSVRTNQNGYLYVINQTENTTGAIISGPTQIFPESNIDKGRNDVKQNDVKILPSGCQPGSKPCHCSWQFDSTAGREVIIVVFTRESLDLSEYRSGDRISPAYTAKLKSEWERMKIADQIKSNSNPDLSRQQNGGPGPHAKWVTNYNLKSNEKLIWFIYLSNGGKTGRPRQSGD